MELLQVAAGILLLLALVAMIVVWALWKRSRGAAARLIANAEKESKRIVARSEIEGQRIQKDAEILARERLLAARTEFERETRDLRVELSGLASRLGEQEEELEVRAAELTERDQAVVALEADIQDRNGRLSEHEQDLERAILEQRSRLEQIAGLTVEQAKAELLRSMENEARIDAANVVKRIEDETVEKSKEKARRVISMAIQRIASEHVVESTVSVVDLPSDEMKGRIIGREGRNIRAFEQATGVDLIVDDTPGAVILSCFEPVRREIARQALANLIQDGRIHPGRIEELVVKVQGEMEEKLLSDGEAAALEVGIPDLHPELLKLLGRLQFR